MFEAIAQKGKGKTTVEVSGEGNRCVRYRGPCLILIRSRPLRRRCTQPRFISRPNPNEGRQEQALRKLIGYTYGMLR
jgi:hypothetical protein